MKRKPIFLMSPEHLAASPTRQLLARLKALLKCEESLVFSDRESEPNYQHVEFKNSSTWAEAYREVKHELAKRVHIPKGAEAKAIRESRGHHSRTLEKRSGRPGGGRQR